MKKLLMSGLFILLLVGCASTPASSDTFNELVRLSFNDYDNFLEAKNSGIVYFGWLDRCPDSELFEENYLYSLVSKESGLQENMYLVNLDEELPDALADKDLRAPMEEKYGVKYGPTLLLIIDGEVVEQVEWTPLTADDKTAIPKDTLDNFFEMSGYLE